MFVQKESRGVEHYKAQNDDEQVTAHTWQVSL